MSRETLAMIFLIGLPLWLWIVVSIATFIMRLMKSRGPFL